MQQKMLRNIFRASIAEGFKRNVSTQCEFDVTPNILLWTQTENIFGLIEGSADMFLRHSIGQEENIRLYEERLDLFYQLLGTVIVERNSEQFQRKVDIDCKLAQCRYKIEKSRSPESKKPEKSVEEELNDMLTVLQGLQNSKMEISKENAEIIHSIRKILVVLTPKTNPSDQSSSPQRQISFSFAKQGETNLLNRLKTLQSFWATIDSNLQPSLSKEVKETAQHVLQSLNVEIALKLKELHVEPEDEPPVSLNSVTSSDHSTDLGEDDEEMQPFKDPERMHTFETLQIARRTVKLKNKISELVEELQEYEECKYDKLRKILDKCQDGFEEIEVHYNPDLVALRTETFNLLLTASRTINEIYEKKLCKSNSKIKE